MFRARNSLFSTRSDGIFRENFKITKDGKPTAENPFASNTRFKPEIFAYGLRNPEGMALDEKRQLWDAEMGPKGGDEINLIQPGKNYGWGDVSYGNEYSAKKLTMVHLKKKERISQLNLFFPERLHLNF